MPSYDYAKVTRACVAILDAREKARAAFEAEDKKLGDQLTQLVAVLAAADTKADGDQLTSTYLLLRSNKHAMGRFSERVVETDYKERMEAIEASLLARLMENKAKSMSTSHGTFYREETMKPSCTDWPAFYKFIAENDAFEALEKRVTKKFVQDFIEQNNEMPPGIVAHREVVVRVRTANEKA